MNGRRALMMLTAILFVAVLAPALAAVPPKPVRPAPASPPIATVGSSAIARAELDARAEQALAEFRSRSGNRDLTTEMRDLLRRQVLEGMIRLELLGQEAQRTGVVGAADEAEGELKHMPVFNPGGHFDPVRFANVKATQPQAFAKALAGVQKQLGARKLYAQVAAQYSPPEAETRQAAVRQLATATIDHLSLRLGDFNGNYPEPRESDVLAAYRRGSEDWRRPARATLTVAFVNSPGLDDAAAAVAGARDAWTARMRTTADSVLQQIRGGASFESATAALGAPAHVVVTADNFPRYWQGSDAQRARVLDPAAAGKVVPEPIRAEEGWLLVRVDEAAPPHMAMLADVAKEIRARLRREQREHHDENEQRALWRQLADSIAAPGWQLRYAAVDTSGLAVPKPADSELQRWYQGHIADYSVFDARSGAIVEQPFAQVRGDVEHRWLRDQRLLAGRGLVEALQSAWTAGKRAPAAEARVAVHETLPLVAGSVIDTGVVARALGDSLWNIDGGPRGVGTLPWQRGWIVWQVTALLPRVVPTFEQARPMLAARIQDQHAAADELNARQLFDGDSLRFNQGNVVHFTRLIVTPPDLLQVPLTRAEVEKYHHDHIDKYSAPELVTAKHILIRPADDSPAADRAALERARDLIARLRAGEDFAALAKQYSDDPATRDNGGDLGAFARGTMLAPFEKVAFTLQPGELAPEPVRTPLGYHVLKCVDHVAQFVTDFRLAYAAIASDAAADKSYLMAQARADSMLRVARTPAALRALGVRMGYVAEPMRWQTGDEMRDPKRKALFDDLARLQPGEVRRPAELVKGDGYWIAWVDSITPPQPPTWEQARTRVLAEYRRGAGRRALDAKKAELDSLFAAGWSLDSVAVLWGGLERVTKLTSGKGIPTVGSTLELDSLLFGGRQGAGLKAGEVSGWIMLQQGYSRVRLIDRASPSEEQLAQRVAMIRSAELEKNLRGYFDGLRARWPVRILDPTLRDVSLVGPPPGITP